MSNLAKDLTGEVIGFFITGFTALVFIIVLVSLGNATGQMEIVKQAVTAIIFIAFGIGIPLGIVSIIKFLSEEFGSYQGI